MLPVLLALALLLAACGGAASAPPSSSPRASDSGTLTKLNVSYSALSATSSPEWVAKGAGFFQKQGLDVSLPFLSPATLTAGLIGGSVDIGFGSPGSVAAPVFQGGDLTIISAN